MKPVARCLLGTLFAGLSLTGMSIAQTPAYPSKPIHIVVPTAPGGGIDVTTRLISPKLGEGLGQPVIVENHPGADNTIGTEMVAKAAPDGYTLLGVFDNFPLTQFLMKNVPYDALRDFTGVALIFRGPMLVVVPAQLNIKNLGQFVQFAKSKSGSLSYASAGVGSSSHLTVELFKATTGIDVQAVHYKGAGPAVTDLLGAHVQLMISSIGTILSQVKAGKVVALAVTASKRLPQLPEVPTVAETFPGFEARSWMGIVAPAGTPREIVGRVNAEIVRVLADREVRGRLEDQSYEVVGGTPEAFQAWMTEQSAKWSRLIRERKITQD